MNQESGTLSGGEQQMVAIGRAQMARPSMLLLDEPSLGIAPRLVADIFESITRVAESGTTTPTGGAEHPLGTHVFPARLCAANRRDRPDGGPPASYRRTKMCGRAYLRWLNAEQQ